MQANVIVDPRGKYLKTQLECLEMMNIHPSCSLELFCILLKLYTTKFQGERSSLRRAPQKQEKLAQEPGMKMLTAGSKRRRPPTFAVSPLEDLAVPNQGS